ncbi:hypothetical protein LROSL1_1177 [Furfurilactobacillus rossiae]|uniref:hypothetical protein n=1 Tax=Furfurilactobacillus rossiae TaxID=231049 RepID=UPI0015BE08B3|nr:hypothetical protein [Furfurilactobacillus rossiae]QLE63994.1 hypothetical protein LROSL1_1177 [Furfurilactobacillus rossiae]
MIINESKQHLKQYAIADVVSKYERQHKNNPESIDGFEFNPSKQLRKEDVRVEQN